MATKKIEPGEIVFEERPLVVGPCKHAKKPVCLVCLSPVVNVKECGKCGWPMCSEKCSDSHGAFEECEIISADVPRDGGAVDYQAIMPLRVALLKTNDPTAWEYFLTFMDHCEERRSTSSWAADEKWVTDQISTRWKYGELTKDESEGRRDPRRKHDRVFPLRRKWRSRLARLLPDNLVRLSLLLQQHVPQKKTEGRGRCAVSGSRKR